jgi:hypothetical protein
MPIRPSRNRACLFLTSPVFPWRVGNVAFAASVSLISGCRQVTRSAFSASVASWLAAMPRHVIRGSISWFGVPDRPNRPDRPGRQMRPRWGRDARRDAQNGSLPEGVARPRMHPRRCETGSSAKSIEESARKAPASDMIRTGLDMNRTRIRPGSDPVNFSRYSGRL